MVTGWSISKHFIAEKKNKSAWSEDKSGLVISLFSFIKKTNIGSLSNIPKSLNTTYQIYKKIVPNIKYNKNCTKYQMSESVSKQSSSGAWSGFKRTRVFFHQGDKQRRRGANKFYQPQHFQKIDLETILLRMLGCNRRTKTYS